MFFFYFFILNKLQKKNYVKFVLLVFAFFCFAYVDAVMGCLVVVIVSFCGIRYFIFCSVRFFHDDGWMIENSIEGQ